MGLLPEYVRCDVLFRMSVVVSRTIKNRHGETPGGIRPRRLTRQRAPRPGRVALYLVIRRLWTLDQLLLPQGMIVRRGTEISKLVVVLVSALGVMMVGSTGKNPHHGSYGPFSRRGFVVKADPRSQSGDHGDAPGESCGGVSAGVGRGGHPPPVTRLPPLDRAGRELRYDCDRHSLLSHPAGAASLDPQCRRSSLFPGWSQARLREERPCARYSSCFACHAASSLPAGSCPSPRPAPPRGVSGVRCVLAASSAFHSSG